MDTGKGFPRALYSLELADIPCIGKLRTEKGTEFSELTATIQTRGSSSE
jgi:hypothetical protein